MKKNCIVCDREMEGRADKKYCSRACEGKARREIKKDVTKDEKGIDEGANDE